MPLDIRLNFFGGDVSVAQLSENGRLLPLTRRCSNLQLACELDGLFHAQFERMQFRRFAHANTGVIMDLARGKHYLFVFIECV